MSRRPLRDDRESPRASGWHRGWPARRHRSSSPPRRRWRPRDRENGTPRSSSRSCRSPAGPRGEPVDETVAFRLLRDGLRRELHQRTRTVEQVIGGQVRGDEGLVGLPWADHEIGQMLGVGGGADPRVTGVAQGWSGRRRIGPGIEQGGAHDGCRGRRRHIGRRRTGGLRGRGIVGRCARSNTVTLKANAPILPKRRNVSEVFMLVRTLSGQQHAGEVRRS